MSGERLRVIVVDDEPVAVSGLVRLLRRDAELDVLAECLDGESAVEAIRDARPDLVFLDVQMPEVDGFEVLRRLEGSHLPSVVFVTAFDRFAVRAFEVNAVDYLLKPFDDERLVAAVARAKRELRTETAGALADRLVRLIGHVAPRPENGGDRVSQLVVRDAGRVRFVPLRDVDWIEGADDSVRLHVGGRSVMLRESLVSLAARLDPDRFFRIHRSAIVNLDRVRELRPDAQGAGEVVLADGTRLKLGRARRARLEELVARVGDRR